MSDDERITRLLQAALESDRTLGEACADSPDLLSEVRRRWDNCRRIEAELRVMFPSGRSAEPSDATDFELPRIPGYEVVAVLGRGGMGVVYRARHLRLRRTVALKMMLSGAYASLPERVRFLREAQAVAALRHPHVVQVHDAGECDGRPYFTMEIVEGGSLAERLGGAPQPVSDAATMVETLAGAVDSAHQCGIVHRDLKPSNVLLAIDGAPKVSDFGLACHVEADDALTLTGARIGTPSYMAPEQASGRASAVGPAADVYALGAILYEMLTGRPPFRGESPADTLRQLLAEDPVRPSRLNARVPRDVETICLKCLRKDPDRRYATAAALAEDLSRFRRGEPILARPTGRIERVAKWARRHPGTAVSVAVGLVLLFAMAGGGLWFASQRAATARLAEEDLRDVARHEREFAWAEARTSLERARTRLGDGGPAVLRRRIGQGDRELKLVAQLDAVRLERASGSTIDIDCLRSYRVYESAFREFGLGTIGEDPAVVAARIRALDIRPVLIAALDDWVVCTNIWRERRWLMEVAQHADGDPTDWRARARDPAVWRDKDALAKLVTEVNDAMDAVQPSVGAARTDASATLLVTLSDHLQPALGNRAAIPYLTRVQRAHPDDYWVNFALGRCLFADGRAAEAARYYQAAVSIRPDAAIAHVRLGEALSIDYRTDEGLSEFHQAGRLAPTWFIPPFDTGTTLLWLGRNEEAVTAFDGAVRLVPGAATRGTPPELAQGGAAVHTNFAHALQAVGRTAEAIEHSEIALALDPHSKLAAHRLRDLEIGQGRREEAAAVWQRSLELDPAGPESDWQGYAELCLLLGRDDEFRRVRQALLARFGATQDAYVADRAGRACMLLPGSDEELQRATAMIDRAVANSGARGSRANFLFAKGLSEYRHDRLASTVAYMNGEAGQVLRPAPILVRVMAQFRLGSSALARKDLAACILAFDWRPEKANDAEAWMFHILRREAERLMLPDLPAVLAGQRRPADNYQRIAMTGACQFAKRYVMRAQLWSDVLSSEPRWAAAGRRYAAGAATQAGTDAGSDTGTLTIADRARWREKARNWIAAELAAADATLKEGKGGRERLLSTLTYWSTSPDLAGVRDEAALKGLTESERAEWAPLWGQVRTLLDRVRTLK